MFGYTSSQIIMSITMLILFTGVLFSVIHVFVHEAMEDFVKTTTIRLIDTLDTNESKNNNENDDDSDNQSEQSIIDPAKEE